LIALTDQNTVFVRVLWRIIGNSAVEKIFVFRSINIIAGYYIYLDKNQAFGF
jgi:hypothetical protein